MKVPLEPIPTEQIVLVESKERRADIQRRESKPSAEPERSQLDKAYPWLLGASICLSAMLCWMYVNKPVIHQSAVPDPASSVVQPVTGPVAENEHSGRVPTPATDNEGGRDRLIPSDRLPGSEPELAKQAVANVGQPATPQKVDPGALIAKHQGDSSVGLGWEATNLKVQHILSADSGSGELEKIVINVPVLYQTRSMRWTPEDIAKARTIMGRLMVYERNLTNVRREGQAILKDWNDLIEATVPSHALRADSPSLPYNHGQGNQSGYLPENAEAIKVEQK